MPLLSIIIPTHNRAQYAVATIKSLLSIEEDIEIVVSDSSAVDNITAAIGEDVPRSRLKIVRSGAPISVVENFNSALQVAEGDFLVFIGDDDFVSAQIVPLAKWAKSNSVDALKLNFPALYYWPDFIHSTRGDSYSGTLHIAPFTGKITAHNSMTALKYALSNFGGGVFEMPRAYAGMLSAQLARDIVAKYGSLFGGVSPDIYSSALISCEAKKCVVVDFPVVIPGASGESTAGQSAAGGHRGKLRDNNHISAFKDLKWDPRIPEFYSVPTVWSFSLLKAVEAIVEKNGTADVSPNFGRLILKCLAYHPKQLGHTRGSLLYLCRTYGHAKIAGQLIGALWGEAVWGFGRIKNRIHARYVKRSIDVFPGLQTTLAARESLERYISAQEKRLDF